MAPSGRSWLVVLLVSATLCAHVSAAASNDSTVVLAAERTRRKDPLDGLRYYTGGWNISNRHYLAVSSSFLVVAAGCRLPVQSMMLATLHLMVHGVVPRDPWRRMQAVGRFQRGARVRVRRALVRRGRGGGARRLLLPRRRRQQLLLLAPGARALAPAPARLHRRGRHRVRRSVRRAAQVQRQHDGDAGLRGEPGRRRRGHHAQLHGPPADGQDGGRRRGLAAPRRRTGHRRRRAPGGRGLRRARRARRQQLPQDPDCAGHHKEGPDWRRGRDARPRVSWLGVLVDREEVACVHSGVSWMDHNHCDTNTVRHFPSPAQRDRRHLRGHGRVGGPAAGAEPHGAGRHPPLRRRGGDGGGPAPEQGGQLAARLQAQRAGLQRVQPRRACPGRPSVLLQPVRASRAAALQHLQHRPLRPTMRHRRGHRRQRATGVATLRVPRDGRAGVVGAGGVLDGGPPDAGDVLPDGHRGRPQRRAAPAVPRPGRHRELRDRAARVPDGEPARLPPAAAGQQPVVPGAAGGVGGRDARRGGVAGALPGAAPAPGERAVQGVPVQAPLRGEGAAQQPEKAVQASVI